VRALLETKSSVLSQYLAEIPPDVPLWAATDDDLRPAYGLWEAVIKLPGVVGTKMSMLLARKRPHLIPIVDNAIGAGLPLGGDSWRKPLPCASRRAGTRLHRGNSSAAS
jgi:hypothetical protein